MVTRSTSVTAVDNAASRSPAGGVPLPRPVKWVLAGGAFLFVVASAGGCGSIHVPLFADRTVVAPAPKPFAPDIAQGSGDVADVGPFGGSGVSFATPDASKPAFDELQPAADRAPVVNVFGEFDGVRRGAVPVEGEAGFQQHTFIDEGFDADVAVDPSGKWLAYTSTRHSEHADVYLQRADGQSVIQLTSDNADDASPAFSPDGNQIAFASTRCGNWDLYVMDVDGRNVTQLTSGPTQDLHPSFSPDGGRIVYSSIGGKSGQWELWVANLKTGERKMIGYGLFPSWSPDHAVDRIAFQKSRQRGGRWFSLWTLDLVDGEARRVSEVALSNNAAVVSPAWSADGKRLAFSTIVEPGKGGASKTVGGDPHAAGPQDVWVINADGTGRRRLTDGSGTNLTPAWAPGNRIYFVSDRGGKDCVWSANAGGAGRVAADTEASAKPIKPAETESKRGTEAVGSTDPFESGR